MRTPFPIVLSALLIGCIEVDLPSESKLDRLRILSAKAEPAEPAPGDTVTMQSLTWSPESGDIGVVWEMCMSADCPTVRVREDPGPLLDAGVVDVAEGIVGLEPATPPSFTVPRGLLDGMSEADQQEGTFLRFGLTAVPLDVSGATELEWATKDLPISASDAPNKNPVLTGIVVDGVAHAPGDTLTVSGGALSLALADEDTLTEDYTFQSSDGETEARTEDLSVSWYSDLGALEGDTWSPGSGAKQGVLIVVVRDGRGGTDWLTFSVNRQ